MRTYEVSFAHRASLLDDGDLAAVAELIRSNDPLSGGRRRDAFEAAFAAYTGTRHALSVTSGTVALEIAIRLLGLEPGDEVIVTPQTYHATIQALLEQRVRVVFCDVDPRSINMDPAALASLIGPRTRAVVLVHYGGLPAEMDTITTLARAHGAVVIEDCAHALGASYRGRMPGSLGDIGCFSFFATKNITTLGQGGMLTFDRDDWAERVRQVRANEIDGRFVPLDMAGEPAPASLPWMKFHGGAYQRACVDVIRTGTNANMPEAAAVVGLSQLAKLGSLIDRRRQIAARLDSVVDGFPEVRPHRPPPDVEHAYHLYTFFADAGNDARDQIVRELDSRGVEVQLRYFPLHLRPEWRRQGHGPGECPVAEDSWFSRHVNLPCHPGLSDDQVDFLAHALKDSLAAVLADADARHEAIEDKLRQVDG
ncbi:DegT/DnrJ/EryC1/StrS family aminotransferase [Actinopolymorpha pittospori]|uniref:dTDP-4-amino-4,6-dideoxygalactose transaminase n=1 Tax=Actinopolymorpha pittospori TaxID=648752 RepID=A0A927RHV9_9ACTN|nr:DegT/DnrJ/EryC1/StrS family aminotransferase [Actinopolymorpha pittospori]MBE1603903.1 dTDP-4-amino-4,6-dideoxygalactose transaminase [Actinopolymorpha pittospori]